MPRSRKLLATVVPATFVAGAVALGGCGGSGSSSSSAPIKPTSPNAGTGVVTPDGSSAFVGPFGRVTAKSKQFADGKVKIPPRVGKPPKGGPGVVGENCPNITVLPDDTNLASVNQAVSCLVNAQRAANGNLPPLNNDSRLQQAAQGMCGRMVSEHFFSHVTPDGKTVVDRVEPTGYIPASGDWVVGENLAWGSGGLATPQAIVNGWMNSPGHRANILAPDYKDIGFAACQGPPSTQFSGGTTYVNDFGARSGADLTATLPGEGATQATAAAKQRARAAARKKRRHHRHHRSHRRHRRHHRRA